MSGCLKDETVFGRCCDRSEAHCLDDDATHPFEVAEVDTRRATPDNLMASAFFVFIFVALHNLESEVRLRFSTSHRRKEICAALPP